MSSLPAVPKKKNSTPRPPPPATAKMKTPSSAASACGRNSFGLSCRFNCNIAQNEKATCHPACPERNRREGRVVCALKDLNLSVDQRRKYKLHFSFLSFLDHLYPTTFPLFPSSSAVAC